MRVMLRQLLSLRLQCAFHIEEKHTPFCALLHPFVFVHLIVQHSHRMTNHDKYKVPPGFRQLLEALAREVLRNQPSDIYLFSALFFERLLLHRDGRVNKHILTCAFPSVLQRMARCRYRRRPTITTSNTTCSMRLRFVPVAVHSITHI